MPILEDVSVAYLETRINELMGIKRILDNYHDLVLNVRVGGTDFPPVLVLGEVLITSTTSLRFVIVYRYSQRF